MPEPDAPELDLDTARWLTSDEGLDAVDDATALLDEGADELTLIQRLRRDHEDPARTSALAGAADARRRARRRFSEADRLLFTRSSLEQASDPAVSRWRAGRFEGRATHDLCAGAGGDAMALARQVSRLVAVDHDPARLALLRHNLGVLGLEVTTRVADVLSLRLPPDELVHVDPSRRRGTRRIIDPHATIPPVDALAAAHGHVAGLAIVCAPGVDADHPALPPDVEVEYVQLGGQLIEAVAWTRELRRDAASASATLLDPGAAADTGEIGDLVVGHLARRGPRPARLPAGALGSYLVEVAPAAVRARLHDDIGAGIGARRVARRRALLTTDELPDTSPWYRARPVHASLPARPRAVRAWLSRNDSGPLEIVLHGVEADPEQWWRALGRPVRGPGGARLELIRRDDDAIAVVTDDRGT